MFCLLRPFLIYKMTEGIPKEKYALCCPLSGMYATDNIWNQIKLENR